MIKKDFKNPKYREDFAEFLIEIGLYELAYKSYYEAMEIYSD